MLRPTAPHAPIVVLINKGASTASEHAKDGDSALNRIVQSAATDAGIKVRVEVCEPGSIASAMRRAAQDDSLEEIWVAGGDGTVSAAAASLIGTNKVLGILPLGTLNLLATDLGVPRDVGEAVEALANAPCTRIDAGEVNGHPFLVHSTLGVYPWMVRRRKEASSRAQKIRATWVAGVRAIRSAPRVSVSIETPDGRYEASTYTLTVTVGHIRPGGPFLEGRSLRDGKLVFHLVRARRRFVLAGIAMRAALSGIEGSRRIETSETPFARITSERPRIPLSLDGEVLLLDTPLEYRILPEALRVRAPAARPSRDSLPAEPQETLPATA